MQDLADLIRRDGVRGGAAFPKGMDGVSGKEDPDTHHLAAVRGMTMALTALRGLVRLLGLVEDSDNHNTFSLTLGKRQMGTPCIPRLRKSEPYKHCTALYLWKLKPAELRAFDLETSG